MQVKCRKRVRCVAGGAGMGALQPAVVIIRAADQRAAAVEDARLDHRRAHVVVPEQLLHRADVVAGLQ